MSREGTWIDSKGKVHDLVGLNHETFARQYLARNGIRPTASAKQAAKASKWSRSDAGPAMFELLRRGWVRQRGCDFTVWKMNGPTAMSVAIGADHLWCPRLVVEACNDKGCRLAGSWPSVRQMGEEFGGLRRRKRRRKR